MILVLLDHPWPLEATLDSSSVGFQVLREFDTLAKTHALKPVPFVSQAEYDQAWLRTAGRYSGRALGELKKLAGPFVRSTDGRCLATPSQGPADLSGDWRCALREAAAADWRNPQIVVSGVRRAVWPGGEEVEIRLEPCDNEPDLPPQARLLAVLDSYESHPFVRSDFDPWDLRRFHPPALGTPERLRHPCCLPRPPQVREGLGRLDDELANARQGAWGRTGKYYFIPQASWKFERISKEDWRRGRAFPYGRCKHRRDVSGYIDLEGREWVWDADHGRHWDVQLGIDYVKISHTGDRLP